jgi:hypothetical protein
LTIHHKDYIKNNCEKNNCDLIKQLEKSSNIKANPWIETKGSKKDKNSFLISRSNLVFNYYSNISFIFRATNTNNFEIHHKDSNPLNDTPDNLIVLTKLDHGRITSDITKIRKEIKSEFSKVKRDQEKIIKAAEELEKLMFRTQTSKEFYELVTNINECMIKNKIYEIKGEI